MFKEAGVKSDVQEVDYDLTCLELDIQAIEVSSDSMSDFSD